MTAEPAPAPPEPAAGPAPARVADAVPVVELRHISREFGTEPRVRALRDVDLTLDARARRWRSSGRRARASRRC